MFRRRPHIDNNNLLYLFLVVTIVSICSGYMIQQPIEGFENTTSLEFQIYLETSHNVTTFGGYNPQGLIIGPNDIVNWVFPESSYTKPHTVTLEVNRTSDNLTSLENFSLTSQKDDIRIPIVIYWNGSKNYLGEKNRPVLDGLSYNMTGHEKYVNSGLIFPRGTIIDGSPSVSSFAIKFNKPGLYPFQCLVHPKNIGLIVVRPSMIAQAN